MRERILENSESLSAQRLSPGRKRIYPVLKRGFDLAVSLFLLVLSFPLVVLIVIAVVIDSPGSPILIQRRVGKDGKLFDFYKFRSMDLSPQGDNHREYMRVYINSYVNGNNDVGNGSETREVFKPKGGNRVTRVGRLLRKTSLDELPQLLNVIKGEMSLVGPRPPIYYEVEEYKAWHFRRFEVLPGITGLAQINGRSQIPFADIVQWDIQYIEHRSLFLDVMILVRTVPTVLLGRGSG